MVRDRWVALKARLRLTWEFVGLADWLSIKVGCKGGHITVLRNASGATAVSD